MANQVGVCTQLGMYTHSVFMRWAYINVILAL